METRAAQRTAESENPFTTRLVSAIAAAEGVDPTELTPRLYDIIDIEALENLYPAGEQAAQSGLSVTFEYCSWLVHVDPDGEITLTQGEQLHGDEPIDTEGSP